MASKQKFTPKEAELITRLYPNTRADAIAALLGVTVKRIYYYAVRHGIRKSEEFRRNHQLNGAHNLAKYGAAHHYPKGHVPHNKGQSMPEHVYAKAKHTMFKKGNQPKNTKYDGCITVRRDKCGKAYQHIRIAKAHWVMLHKYVWEQEHGPVPRGMVVRFIDGDTLNVALSNLELVSRGKHLEKNRTYPPEIADVKKMLGIAKRMITFQNNKKTKQHGKE